MRTRRFSLQSLMVYGVCGSVVLGILFTFMPFDMASAQSSAYTGARFPYQEFADLPPTRMSLGESVLEIAFAPGTTRVSRKDLLAWTKRSAESIVAYYGRLPTSNAKLLFVPVSGRGINGTTFGFRGPASRILIGSNVTSAGLESDWVLVHELVHQGFPSLAGGRRWAHEGLATYVEPIARAQLDLIPVEEVWRQLIIGLPKGQPEDGDKGLDGTPTWGRTYWGGAMYFLVADVEIRRRTRNQRGLQQVLQYTVARGGNIGQEWSIERFNAMADRASGTAVMSELYACLKDKPHTIDLRGLWRALGISMSGRHVKFNDDAPLAHIRRAITEPQPVLARVSQSVPTARSPGRTDFPCRSFPWINDL